MPEHFTRAPDSLGTSDWQREGRATGQDKTGQDRIGQDRTGRDRTGQDSNVIKRDTSLVLPQTDGRGHHMKERRHQDETSGDTMQGRSLGAHACRLRRRLSY